MKKIFTWKKYHKWVGVVFALFMLVFCVSGIILNHRQLFSHCDVSRSWLPPGYHISNFNNGVVKGTVPFADGKVVAFGSGGVWMTNPEADEWTEINLGFPSGVDHRNIRNLVRMKDGSLWCATNYDVYRYEDGSWHAVSLSKGDERLMDLALSGDSMQVVALSRSAAYVITPSKGGSALKAERKELKAAKDGFKPQEYLFRTIWKLHSGELFGIPGKLVVDIVAVIIILLSLTGIVLFLLPYCIRRRKRRGDKDGMKKADRQMVWHQRWHNRFGRYTVILTVLLTLTGTCLRPPLMIPFVMVKTAPVNYTGNIWNDRLRALRWDARNGEWLVSTADGFMRVDSAFAQAPRMIAKEKAPTVSPMGVNVFRQQKDGRWLIGSFSGMTVWDAVSGKVEDYFTHKAPGRSFGSVTAGSTVSGYSEDFGKPLVFDYSQGADRSWIPMPEAMTSVPLSLWNFALELHVGRCYAPLLGPLSELFVFLWGTLSTLVLLSGYIILRRRNAKGEKRRVKNPTASKQRISD